MSLHRGRLGAGLGGGGKLLFFFSFFSPNLTGEFSICVKSWSEKRLGTWILGWGIIGRDYRDAFTDCMQSPSDFNTVNLLSVCRHNANPPCVDQTPHRQIILPKVCHLMSTPHPQKRHPCVMHTYMHVLAHTSKDLGSQHANALWVWGCYWFSTLARCKHTPLTQCSLNNSAQQTCPIKVTFDLCRVKASLSNNNPVNVSFISNIL